MRIFIGLVSGLSIGFGGLFLYRRLDKTFEKKSATLQV